MRIVPGFAINSARAAVVMLVTYQSDFVMQGGSRAVVYLALPRLVRGKDASVHHSVY